LWESKFPGAFNFKATKENLLQEKYGKNNMFSVGCASHKPLHNRIKSHISETRLLYEVETTKSISTSLLTYLGAEIAYNIL
jgi:mRNA-degrading endonuclease RelE of RelBE toxin-antitoxin system